MSTTDKSKSVYEWMVRKNKKYGGKTLKEGIQEDEYQESSF